MTLRMTLLWIVLQAVPALACGPGPCDAADEISLSCLGYSRWENRECYANLPWLDPGNDSVKNAAIVQNPATPFANSDLGARPCRTNTADNAALFTKAVDDAKPADAAALKDARKALVGQCGRIEGADEPGRKIAALGPSDFKTYLEASHALYHDKAAESLAKFAALKTSKQAWIAETATYLVGRVALIEAQKNWSGLGDLKAVDTARTAEGKAALDAYLTAHPQGAYATSARGLLRRVIYFSGDHGAFGASLFQAIEDRAASPAELDLGVEYAGKSIPWDYPISAAAGVMVTLRDPAKSELAPDAMERLDRARAKYDRYPGLFAFMKSATLLAKQDLAGALAQTPTIPAHYSLLAQALEREKRYKDARPYWQKLLQSPEAAGRPAVVIALGRNYLLAGEVEALAAKDSPLFDKADEKTLFNLFRQGATTEQLERIADGDRYFGLARKASDRLLLGRYLVMGEWEKFAKRIEASPNRKDFEPVETAVKTLAKNPADPKALLNAAYYMHHDGQGPKRFGPMPCESAVGKAIGEKPAADLAAAHPPIDHYRKAMAAFKPGDRDEVEAKLLFYTLHCFRRGEQTSSCLWDRDPDQVAPVSERKAWFKRLKSKYASSKWGRELKVYY